MSELLIDELLARDDISAAEPPGPAEIDAILDQVPSLPPQLLKLWRAANGVQLETIGAELLSPAAAVEMAPILGPEELGFLPLLDTHQSNYVGVMIREPLSPRVGYISHDDGPEGMMLKFRDVDSFLRSLIDALDTGENADLYYYDHEGDYAPDSPRTAADEAAAKALLATDGSHGEWNWAIGLLDAANIPEWQRLLETKREVRSDVLMRLKTMSDPAIRELVASDERAVHEFAEKLADAAREAGFKVGECSGSALRVNNAWWDPGAFFYKRNKPDAIRRIIAWFKDRDHDIFNEE